MWNELGVLLMLASGAVAAYAGAEQLGLAFDARREGSRRRPALGGAGLLAVGCALLYVVFARLG